MEQIAKPGDCCPNEACPDYQKLQSHQSKPNVIKADKTRKGGQRFRCNTCGKYFVETTGTICYRKRTPEEEMLETLALLAEGSRISSLARGTKKIRSCASLGGGAHLRLAQGLSSHPNPLLLEAGQLSRSSISRVHDSSAGRQTLNARNVLDGL